MEVIAIDYSLAPEIPYPTALNEIYDIVNYLSKSHKNI